MGTLNCAWGTLVVQRVGARSVIHTARATSPLRFILPRNHGVGAWATVTHFGGGLVDGDETHLHVDVGRESTALICTQASTKVYPGARGARQSLSANVGDGALLAIVPDPVVCFAGARFTQSIDLALTGSASLVLIDGLMSGRAARGERWAFDRYASRTRITAQGKLVLHDSLVLDPQHGCIADRMGEFHTMSSVVAVGPQTGEVRARIAASAEQAPDGAGVLFSAAALGESGIVGRVFATTSDFVMHTTCGWLAPLFDDMGDDPFSRRW